MLYSEESKFYKNCQFGQFGRSEEETSSIIIRNAAIRESNALARRRKRRGWKGGAESRAIRANNFRQGR